jgi:hypothetical protein
MANKIDIRADVARNRLYLVLIGFFQDDEVKTASDKCIAEASKLKPGFDVINDISQFKPASPKGAEEIKRAQLFIKQHGVKRVIRIVGDAVITQAQFSRQEKEVGYNADTAATLAEAEKILDGK